MYARDKMDSKETRLAPIPVDFIIEQGLKEHTEAKRRPYRTLITTWAEHEGMSEQGETIVSQLDIEAKPEQKKDLNDLLDLLMPKYRKPEKLEQLVKIIEEVDKKVINDNNWTWAIVMKVMLDEGILLTNIPNKFEHLIRAMLPGKSIDKVRKNGDYLILKIKRPWHKWISNPHDDPEEAAKRAICEEIFEYFKEITL